MFGLADFDDLGPGACLNVSGDVHCNPPEKSRLA